jgi:hypothetical protein
MSAREREAARKRQRDLERAEVRTRRRRRLRTAAILLAAVALLIGLEIFLHRPNGEERALLAAAPAALRQSECGPVEVIKPFPGDRDRTHIGGSEQPVMPPLSEYPSRPPVSGPHNPTPLHAGVYGTVPPIDQAIHSLEHAAVIIWYDPAGGRSAEVGRIKRFFAQGNEVNHVIVAPYDYPAEGEAGRLAAGTGMALAAWHHLQTCRAPNLAVAYQFVTRYRVNLYRFWEYRGNAPERWFAPV